jgi:protein-S-isoprenylcysteine O-methyltransferase Ste14
VGNMLMLLGVGLISNSIVFVLIIVPIFCFIYQCIVLAEEYFLRNKFGTDYEAYARRVNRWIPNLRGIGATLGSMQFNWRRYVLNEYNTVYMLLVGTYIVMAVYSPPLATQPAEQRLLTSAIVFGALTLIYLFVRFLKKTKRINPALAAER